MRGDAAVHLANRCVFWQCGFPLLLPSLLWLKQWVSPLTCRRKTQRSDTRNDLLPFTSSFASLPSCHLVTLWVTICPKNECFRSRDLLKPCPGQTLCKRLLLPSNKAAPILGLHTWNVLQILSLQLWVSGSLLFTCCNNSSTSYRIGLFFSLPLSFFFSFLRMQQLGYAIISGRGLGRQSLLKSHPSI